MAIKKIWAIADLHLSFGVPNKGMEIFGPQWISHAEKIKKNWERLIDPCDLVLLAGDISWAMRPHEALIDLQWIDALPGTKVMIRGNHDYWWSSYRKVQQMLPPSLHAIHHNAWNLEHVSIGGTRLWDSPDLSFRDIIAMQNRQASISMEPENKEEMAKIYVRELARLKMSLEQMDKSASIKIVMTHFPPVDADCRPSAVSALLEEYQIDYCIFGHLHSLRKDISPFGVKNGVHYLLTSCDYLDFVPLRVI